MPSPPSPPNPRETAAAEARGNTNTAIANTLMGNANVRGFDGNTTRSNIIGYEEIDDGNGGRIRVPRFEQINTLSPENQWLYGQRQHLTSIGQDAAIQAMNRINQNARTDLDFSDNPAAGTVATVPTLDRVGGGPQLRAELGGVGAVQSGLAGAGDITRNVAVNPVEATFRTDFAGAAPVPGLRDARGNGGFGGFNWSGPTTPQNLPELRSSYETQQASAAFDRGPGVSQSFANVGPMTDSVALGRVGTDFAGGGQVQTSLGPQDWSDDRRRVEDAIYSRLDPAFDRQQVGLEERLRNQGLVEGTEAWNRRMDEIGRQRNDARMQAVLAGGQEQSRLAALAQMQGQFANQAQAQQFEQARQRGLFGITATGFNNDATIGEGQFRNQAQQQAFNQAQARGAFANQAAGQIFDQNLTAAQFGNQVIGQNNATNRDLAAFANQARGQEQSAALQRDQLAMQAALQGGSLNAQLARLELDAQQQQFAQNMAGAAFYNDATARQAALAAQNNRLALDQAQFVNAAQQQQFAQNLAGGQFVNAAQQQQFAQALAGAGLTQQEYQNQLAQAGFNNQAAGQTFNMQQAAFDAQNNLRERSIQEELIRRNQITNEWAAINSGTQMQLPQAQQFRAGQIANTDYSNIVNQSYQQQMQAYNAQMSGMFGLGGTLARGMFGLMG